MASSGFTRSLFTRHEIDSLLPKRNPSNFRSIDSMPIAQQYAVSGRRREEQEQLLHGKVKGVKLKRRLFTNYNRSRDNMNGDHCERGQRINKHNHRKYGHSRAKLRSTAPSDPSESYKSCSKHKENELISF